MKQGVYSDNILPKFFKVYRPGESSDDLEIPVSFNRFLPKPCPRNVVVRSIYGKVWKLELRKCGGDIEKLAMVDGWKRILKDKGLKGGDFLTFEFDGSRLFNFCVFERETMCKRFRRISVQSDEMEAESAGEEETGASDDVAHLDDDDDDADDNDAADAADDDADDDEDEPDDDEADDDDHRKYLDDPENPFFTMILNSNKKSQLHIPAMVIKDYGLNFPERITIDDPAANNFGTLEKKIRVQVNGSVFVIGFGGIIRRNRVKTTDKMVCEVKTGANNLVHTIKINIIRG